ncbi:predicted protein [Chaetomium globosum CBS 148.51]|uniref:Uncharacterized protein n=1 Tax=Chaetomium globosum (strain ATCC 6205 / CBS 148.51 / DSM 1962 / NBRC 6347 / NRRL 1970) TaxID=306901 RepID=Q2GZC8_CHAGB|nr:uncharacterized protein CHGG_05118 [Chaetomium globosum CBS 148.51]EAQ88499.1 predicted protein [Chaetomium globosum CBS 148.51]
MARLLRVLCGLRQAATQHQRPCHFDSRCAGYFFLALRPPGCQTQPGCSSLTGHLAVASSIDEGALEVKAPQPGVVGSSAFHRDNGPVWGPRFDARIDKHFFGDWPKKYGMDKGLHTWIDFCQSGWRRTSVGLSTRPCPTHLLSMAKIETCRCSRKHSPQCRGPTPEPSRKTLCHGYGRMQPAGGVRWQYSEPIIKSKHVANGWASTEVLRVLRAKTHEQPEQRKLVSI